MIANPQQRKQHPRFPRCPVPRHSSVKWGKGEPRTGMLNALDGIEDDLNRVTAIPTRVVCSLRSGLPETPGFCLAMN
jgi:hypothetical protein